MAAGGPACSRDRALTGPLPGLRIFGFPGSQVPRPGKSFPSSCDERIGLSYAM